MQRYKLRKRTLYNRYLENVKNGVIKMMVPIHRMKDLTFHSQHFHLKDIECNWVNIGKYRECLIWNPGSVVFMDKEARRNPKFIKAYTKDFNK